MEIIYSFYKNDLEIYEMLIKYGDKNLKPLGIIFLMNAVIVGILILLISFSILNSKVGAVMLVTAVIVFILVFINFNENMKKSVEDLCDFKNTKIEWNSDIALEKLEKFRIKELDNFIQSHQFIERYGRVCTIDDLDIIRNDFEKKLFELKPKILSLPSFAAVLLTIYTEKFTGVFIELFKIKTVEDMLLAMKVLAVIFIGIFGVLMYIYFVLYKGFIFEIRNKKYSRYKSAYNLFIKYISINKLRECEQKSDSRVQENDKEFQVIF